jgi:signal transduction histidine kinase
LSVLEGIALSSEPGYKVLRAAYPWVARRLLTDRSPELRETLLALLYKDGRFQFSRCESLLREAIKNLVDNALKYGGDGPLQIALTVEGGQAVLTIADHGPGIAAADAERVFERFARGEGVPSGGAGLGLAIVKRVIDSHAGHIDLSNRPQGGLIATIRLPRSNP